jgi:sugar/nucleoside kinase (ribokinase family)
VSQVVVAGHICLDIIPEMCGAARLEPGQLTEVGAAKFATGGCVSNVGLALHRLGVETRLVGKICSDHFGVIIKELIAQYASGLENGLVVCEEGNSSYSVVVSGTHQDRFFLHSPGCNATFGFDDVPFQHLSVASHFHFGYPPLMAKMYSDDGTELSQILKAAQATGMTTSLDMSLPDPNSESGRAPWKTILRKALPYVDYFVPSREELTFMLGDGDHEFLLKTCHEFGAKTVVLKCGEHGLVGFDGQEFMQEPCYKVDVVGTTGAGDATIAGLILGILQGWELPACLQSATAVGACCVEAHDAVSGIRSWQETSLRILNGWNKR